MSDATNALLELRAKIEANRRLLEKQEQALLVMEEMMGISSPKENNVTKPLDFFSGGIDIKSLNVASVGNKKTFKQEILDVVKLFKDQEFSVPHIHEALTRMGIKVNGAQPRARIALVLNDLTADKMIQLTFKGAGNVPNRFKLRNDFDQDLM